MSQARKQALISGLAWLVITVVFAIVFFSVGVEAFAAPSGHKIRGFLAAVILPGYIINFAIIAWSRRGRRAGNIDERDKAIERLATEITFIIMLLTVYLFSIWLYDANAETGTVPAGWFFVLAYGTIALVSLLHPVLTLILDFSGKSDG
jgi:hypothetical protein